MKGIDGNTLTEEFYQLLLLMSLEMFHTVCRHSHGHMHGADNDWHTLLICTITLGIVKREIPIESTASYTYYDFEKC